MPVVSIQPQKRISPFFTYPNSGKARIYLEASSPVDVFLVRTDQANSINSMANALNLGIQALANQLKIENQIFPLPPEWNTTGWNLVIGNGGPDVAAVFYSVFEA